MKTILILGILLGACGDDDQAAEILSCTPETACTCDNSIDTCTCAGGSTCDVAGADHGVTLKCEGNAACNLSCGTQCHVECPGTTGCTATVDDESTLLCTGTGECDFACTADCTAECQGTSRCVVRCTEGATCDVTCPSPTSCPDGLTTACGRACPPPADGGI